MITLLLVRGDHSFGDVVDISEGQVEQPVDDGHDHGAVLDLPVDLIQAPGEEPAVAHPVGPDECLQGDLALCQPVGVLQRCRRRFEALRN